MGLGWQLGDDCQHPRALGVGGIVGRPEHHALRGGGAGRGGGQEQQGRRGAGGHRLLRRESWAKTPQPRPSLHAVQSTTAFRCLITNYAFIMYTNYGFIITRRRQDMYRQVRMSLPIYMCLRPNYVLDEP